MSADHRLVRVIWIDSGMNHTDGWMTTEKAVESVDLARVTTVGILLHEDDDAVAVGQSHDPVNDHWYSIQTIWKPSLVSIEDLTVAQ